MLKYCEKIKSEKSRQSLRQIFSDEAKLEELLAGIEQQGLSRTQFYPFLEQLTANVSTIVEINENFPSTISKLFEQVLDKNFTLEKYKERVVLPTTRLAEQQQKHLLAILAGSLLFCKTACNGNVELLKEKFPREMGFVGDKCVNAEEVARLFADISCKYINDSKTLIMELANKTSHINI